MKEPRGRAGRDLVTNVRPRDAAVPRRGQKWMPSASGNCSSRYAKGYRERRECRQCRAAAKPRRRNPPMSARIAERLLSRERGKPFGPPVSILAPMQRQPFRKISSTRGLAAGLQRQPGHSFGQDCPALLTIASEVLTSARAAATSLLRLQSWRPPRRPHDNPGRSANIAAHVPVETTCSALGSMNWSAVASRSAR